MLLTPPRCTPYLHSAVSSRVVPATNALRIRGAYNINKLGAGTSGTEYTGSKKLRFRLLSKLARQRGVDIVTKKMR